MLMQEVVKRCSSNWPGVATVCNPSSAFKFKIK